MVSSIEQRYIELHPKSAEQYSVSKSIFPNGVTHESRRQDPFPFYVTHAEGPYKWDLDGNRIIDYRTGHGSMILGHSHPDIVAAVTEQMAKGTHYSASTELEIAWAHRVIDMIPCAEKVRFHSSGTEATMMAFRMARAYTGKSKIIKFENHFHGWNDYALAGGKGLGGIPQETLSTMIVLPQDDISAVERTLNSNNDVAAIILEPTGSHMGGHPIVPNFLGELRDVTERHGVVLIFDEVVTGFRTSKGGAQEYFGITPDLTSLAKILGGGLPGGAVAGKRELIDMIEVSDSPDFDPARRISHPGTFNANPLSAAAGTKALELVATTPVNEITDAMGSKLKNGLNDLLSRMEIPGCASGFNSMLFLRLGVDHECDKQFCNLSYEELQITENAQLDAMLSLAMLNRGVHASTRFIMSSAFSEEIIAETVDAFEDALAEVRKEGLL